MTGSLILSLQRHQQVFAGLFANVSRDQINWRSERGKWNMLEAVCHLLDEEREDFRARVKSILDDPTQPLPPIDPEGWVITRKYAEQDFDITVTGFLNERETSVAWLKSLKDPQWDNTYQHPKLGPMSARLFLTNWVAHDLLHIRQITRMHYQYLAANTDISLDYAGKW
ncbi:MAG: DinB family protein [Flavobacteriales bacterium]|nr:DinB family protein [Flavobacteriales bacterium]